MQKNVASQKIIVYAFDSTTNLPKTGDAANITAYISKDFGAVTVLGDTTATEEDATNAKGYYLFDITQTETNADVVRVSAKSSTANIVVIGAPATIFTTPANFTADSIDSNGRRDVIKVAGTTQTARDLGGQLDAAISTRMATYTQPTGFLAATFPTGTIANTTNITAGTITTVTTVTNQLTAAQIATGVWQDTTAGDFTTASSIGKSLYTTGNAPGAASGLALVGSNMGSATSVTARVTANTDQLAGQTVTAGAGVTFPSSVASPTNITAGTITTATNLTTNNDKTGYSLSSAAIQAIWDYATSLLTTVGSIGKLLVTNIDAAISSRSTLGGTAQTGDAYGLLNSAQAEPSSVPAANASPVAKIGYVFAKMRNKRITTATTDTLRNDGDSGNIAAATLSDDGTSFTKTKDA